MAVPSSMVPLGTPAPDFALPDLTGTTLRRDDLAAAPALLVAFLCNHCPYVRHVELRLGELVARYPDLAAVGICTNDAEAYPEDRPEALAEQARRAGWTFPYLVDTDQRVGREFQAACTPDFFLYDARRDLAYRGAFDDSTPGNGGSPRRPPRRDRGVLARSRFPSRTSPAWAARSSGGRTGSGRPVTPPVARSGGGRTDVSRAHRTGWRVLDFSRYISPSAARSMSLASRCPWSLTAIPMLIPIRTSCPSSR